MNRSDIAAIADGLFARLRDASEYGEGVTRPSYSIAESAALDIVYGTAKMLGFDADYDAAMNLRVTLRGSSDLPETWTGSHVDSVPCGGNYDGAAGVVAGLLAMMKIRATAGRSLRRSIQLVGLRGEESAWFGTPYLGSKAILGRLTDEDLNRMRRSQTRSLRECMQNVGATLDGIERQIPLFPPSAIGAFVELHIEQGPALEAANRPLGVVTSVCGNVRWPDAVCIGEAGHSGTVPYDLRKDAVEAASLVVHKAYQHAQDMRASGHDAVATAGIFATSARDHAVSRIADEVRFSLEFRSDDAKTLDELERRQALTTRLGTAGRGAKVAMGRESRCAPVKLDERVADHLFDACIGVDCETTRMPSGAGHDAAVFQEAGVPSGILFVRNQNGSHNPLEAMHLDDFALGVEALSKVLMKLADAP